MGRGRRTPWRLGTEEGVGRGTLQRKRHSESHHPTFETDTLESPGTLEDGSRDNSVIRLRTPPLRPESPKD